MLVFFGMSILACYLVSIAWWAPQASGQRFVMTLYYGGPVQLPTLYVALGTIAVALGLRWINRRFRWALPELLLAIAAAGMAEDSGSTPAAQHPAPPSPETT